MKPCIRYLLMAIEAVTHVLNELIVFIRDEYIERPLTRRPITSSGYNYLHKVLDENPENFEQVYRMYPDVFREFCGIIREKTLLEDKRFICIEEMLATFYSRLDKSRDIIKHVTHLVDHILLLAKASTKS